MISKVDGKALSGETIAPVRLRLSALERGLLKWSVMEPEDKVLDANIGNGTIAEYLRRNMQCEVCGVSNRMEDVRQARGRLRNCDIVYATAEDIPWPNQTFHAVLMKLEGGETDFLFKTLKEIRRVLKNGGQLLLGVDFRPKILHRFFRMVVDDYEYEENGTSRKDIVEILNLLDFEQLSWQRVGVFEGVITCWKRNPDVEQALSDE